MNIMIFILGSFNDAFNITDHITVKYIMIVINYKECEKMRRGTVAILVWRDGGKT
jgi:hypothetical protein